MDEQKVEIPAKFKDLIETIEKMSVLDLAELVKVLEKKFGVSAAPQMVAAAAAPASAGAEAAEEKSSFNVVLTSAGDKKIEVIKVVRDLTQKGLKEAKDLVDAAPKELGVMKKADAEEAKKKLEAAGATVELA